MGNLKSFTLGAVTGVLLLAGVIALLYFTVFQGGARDIFNSFFESVEQVQADVGKLREATTRLTEETARARAELSGVRAEVANLRAETGQLRQSIDSSGRSVRGLVTAFSEFSNFSDELRAFGEDFRSYIETGIIRE